MCEIIYKRNEYAYTIWEAQAFWFELVANGIFIQLLENNSVAEKVIAGTHAACASVV